MDFRISFTFSKLYARIGELLAIGKESRELQVQPPGRVLARQTLGNNPLPAPALQAIQRSHGSRLILFRKSTILDCDARKPGRERMRDRLKPAGETRAADVLHRMRADIISCALKPGAKLRFEALRDMYAVSFSTLREALSRLVAERLVIAEDQRGFLVAPVSIDDLNDLTYVRVLVERECIALAIKRGDDDWEAEIIGAYHRMDRLQNRLGSNYYLSEEWGKLHGEFHFSLVAACGSPNLLEIRQKLFERAHRYRRMSSQFRPKWRAKDVEHKMIMDSVIARDAAKAQELIERHIRETTENVIKYAVHLFAAPDEERRSRAHVAAE
jgi:GntR family transcriptional regulator, carbon starvation induced regulator